MKKTILILLLLIFAVSCNNNKVFNGINVSEYPNVGDTPDEVWVNSSTVAWLETSKDDSHDGQKPAPGVVLAPGDKWEEVNGGGNSYLVINVYDGDPNNGGNYLTTATVHWNIGCAPWTATPPTTMTCPDGETCPPSCPTADGILKITQNGGEYDVLYTGNIVTKPPVISNNWSSGMGNTNETLITPGSYWVQDYGFDDTGRWVANGDYVAQNTSNSPVAEKPTFGSRAYPIDILNDSYKFDDQAPGTGYDGVWQIDIQIGSNSEVAPDSLYCETFYIAERKDLSWGSKYYSDGSPAGGENGWSTEIDIMETKWQKTGPQVNIPVGGGTGWNPNYTKITTPNGLQVGKWTDAGAKNAGGPIPDFATFGAQIVNDSLYFYGYLPGKTDTWYVEGPIVRDNSYVQKHPFVPYIGTWTDSTTTVAGGFETKYKNFIYKKSSDVVGNPATHPENFGPGLK